MSGPLNYLLAIIASAATAKSGSSSLKTMVCHRLGICYSLSLGWAAHRTVVFVEMNIHLDTCTKKSELSTFESLLPRYATI